MNGKMKLDDSLLAIVTGGNNIEDIIIGREHGFREYSDGKNNPGGNEDIFHPTPK